MSGGARVNVETGGGWLALVLWWALCWGEPDIMDAIICALMGSCP